MDCNALICSCLSCHSQLWNKGQNKYDFHKNCKHWFMFIYIAIDNRLYNQLARGYRLLFQHRVILMSQKFNGHQLKLVKKMRPSGGYLLSLDTDMCLQHCLFCVELCFPLKMFFSWPSGPGVPPVGVEPADLSVPSWHQEVPTPNDPHHQYQRRSSHYHADSWRPILRMADNWQVFN